MLRARFAAVLDSVTEAMVVVDGDGRVVFLNRQTEKLFGQSRDELMGKPIKMLFPERCHRQHAAHLERCFAPARQAVNDEAEWFGLRKDGSEFPAEVSLNPLRMEEGAWVVNAIRDISERTHMQKVLSEKNAAIEAAYKELQSFSHSVSHDLRAPLRAMSGFAGMLKKSLGAEMSKETAHALKRIEDNSFKMSQLMDGLLDFSSLSFIAMTRRKANPGELVKSIFNELTVLVEGRHIDFQVDPLPLCNADVVLLRQLFTNLLSNAIKFTRDRDPAVIRVGCTQQKREKVYFIRDNGAGFDMDYADKLFRVFQRLHTPSEFEGTGVGLAVVQRIIQRHGGRIWAESRVDEGATFYFTLGE